MLKNSTSKSNIIKLIEIKIWKKAFTLADNNKISSHNENEQVKINKNKILKFFKKISSS